MLSSVLTEARPGVPSRLIVSTVHRRWPISGPTEPDCEGYVVPSWLGIAAESVWIDFRHDADAR